VNLDAVANVVAIAVNLTVGLRLLSWGRKPDALPERLLGLSLSFDGIEWLLWLLAIYTPAADGSLGSALGFACRAGISASAICLMAFNRVVFRPGSAGALIFAATAGAAMGVGLIGSAAAGDWYGYRVDLPWTWLELGAQAAAFGWTLLESLCCYVKLRRRLAHGLTDAVVVNRVLLWGGYGGALLASHALVALAQYTAGVTGSYPASLDSMMAALTLAACAAVWLAFFAPRAYRDWLRAAPRAPLA